MSRKDPLNGTDVRPGAPISGGPSDGSAAEPDSEATTRPVVDSYDRAIIDQVTL